MKEIFSELMIFIIIGVITVLVVANELRRPKHKEYLRKKAVYPKIPSKYLHNEPISESVIFGKDFHTNKFVAAEQGHHVMIVGSTGSGKTATCLIPSILCCTSGSKQIVDIKSRELVYKTADVKDKNTIIIDLNRRGDNIYGWDLFYKLKKDGSDSEQEVLDVLKEIAFILVPKVQTGEGFWNDAARNEFIGLALYEFCYNNNYEFIDIVLSIVNEPLREHMEAALEKVPKFSLVRAYLQTLSSSEDETLFSVDLTLSQNLYEMISGPAVYFFRDNPKRANPTMLNQDNVTQYLCCSESKLDSGYDKMLNMILKETLMELQSRKTNAKVPQTLLFWDEWQRLTESCTELRATTASFLKTGRSKHVSVVLCLQNLDNIDKNMIYDIISNIHYLYVLSSNNANSLTSEVVCKMAGTYYEKTKNYSEGKGSSVATSYQEKQVLKPEDLNALGDDAVLIITGQGYVRVQKEATAYYKTEPFKTKYEKLVAVNKVVMSDV